MLILPLNKLCLKLGRDRPMGMLHFENYNKIAIEVWACGNTVAEKATIQ
jgi:hypothetical protein